MGNKKPLVVVLSRNYSTGLSIVRSLGQAGYKVDLVANTHKEGESAIARKSKYVRRSVEVVSKKGKSGRNDKLLAELLKYKGKSEEKMILFPVDDYTVSVIDRNYKKLKDIFLMPHIVGGGKGAMMHHMKKTVQGELARAAGLLTPKEWIVQLEEEIKIPEDMVYPCFCKPLESISGYKAEMGVCNDRAELLTHLNSLPGKDLGREILVQEYLEIENEIDLSGVCFDDKVIIPAIIRKRTVAQKEKGVTLSGEIVPFEEMGDLQEKIIKMMQSFHFMGMFDMEFNIVGDKIYFNEVNLRCGGPNYSYFKSGINLPELFVKTLMGEPHEPEEEKVEAYGKVFVYEKVAWEDYIHGFMTRKEWKKCIKSADITILQDENDPEPGKLFYKKMRKKNRNTQIKNAIKNVYNFFKPIAQPIAHRLLGYPQVYKKNRRNPNSEYPRILVAGRNYCSNLCLARSFGKAGYEVEVLKIFQRRPRLKNIMKRVRPDAHSKYVKAYYECVSDRKSPKIVDRLIKLADPNRKMLLVPADDLIAYIADEYMEILKKYYIFPNVNNQPGKVIWLMKKEVQKQLAKEAGLPVINSCIVKTVDGHCNAPDTISYPCFIKPNVSRNSSKGKMKRCESKQELEETLTSYAVKQDVEFIVEDFVEIDKEYSILGVSTKEGANGPGYFVAEEGGQNEHRGVALIGRTLPTSEDQELIDAVVKFVGSLGFDGLYDVDLIKAKDGTMYFVEINMRFGASGYAFTESGVNLPGMFADYMLKSKPIDMNCVVEETDKTFVSEKVLIEEYLMGRIPKAKIKSSLKETDISFVVSKEDPKPYRHFRMFYPIATLRRALGKIMGENQEQSSGS